MVHVPVLDDVHHTSMVKKASLTDVAQIVDLLRQMHSSSSFCTISLDDEMLESSVSRMVCSDEFCVLISESSGKAVGVLIGICAPPWYSKDNIGSDVLMFVTPASRGAFASPRLIRAFVEWCRGRGAKQVRMGISTGADCGRSAEIYKRVCGFRPVGENMMIDL